MVTCRCTYKDCSVVKPVKVFALSRGQRSCGCLARDKARQLIKKLQKPGMMHPAFRHGKSNTTEHNIWVGMIQRCTNPNNTKYTSYGEIGVKVCRRWTTENGFINFLKDMGKRPSLGHSMGRFGDVGNYEPGNCKWMTRSEQEAEAKKKRASKEIGDELTKVAHAFGELNPYAENGKVFFQ